MKRISVAAVVTLLMILVSTCTSFAAGLGLVDAYPEDGAVGAYPVNLGIKLYFDGDVAAQGARAQNEKCFVLAGEDGTEVPVKVLFTDADPNYILVIAEPPDQNLGLGADKQYTLTISGELADGHGNTLEEPKTLTFRTRNTQTDMTVSMVLMGVMFAGMLVFTMISTKRQVDKEREKAGEFEKVDPYKKAKATGRKVEDIVAEEEKKRKKALEEKAKAEAARAKEDKKLQKRGGKRVYKLKRPRPISEGGGTYVSGRKAAADKRAKEAEAQKRKGTTKPKSAKGKSRKKQ